MDELDKLPKKFEYSDIVGVIDKITHNLYEKTIDDIDKHIIDNLREGKCFVVSVDLPVILKKEYMNNIIYEYIKRGFAVFVSPDMNDEEMYIDISFSPYMVGEFCKIYNTVSEVIEELKSSNKGSLDFKLIYGYKDWYGNNTHLAKEAVDAIMRIESLSSGIQIKYDDTYNHQKDWTSTDDKLDQLVKFKAYKL